MRPYLPALLLLLSLSPAPSHAATALIEADTDATLIEHPEGALANGSGPSLFVGRTNQPANSVRRALLRFDVAAALPRRAIVEGVELTLSMTPSNPAPRELRLHRLLAEWGEGPSMASGGAGAPSLPGDATWLHTFYDDDLWRRPGGWFAPQPSARLEIGAAGSYTWTTSRRLIRDVRQWNAAPQRNFGWIVLGDELAPQTVKNFASRESADVSRRPVLRVTYRLPGRRPGRLPGLERQKTGDRSHTGRPPLRKPGGRRVTSARED